MRELSLHINDIVENSIHADATVIQVFLAEDTIEDLLIIRVVDNGKGIPKEKLQSITDPFHTSRKTRRVGLGLSLLEAAAKRCNGSLDIESDSTGTKVCATFQHSHIDRAPIGNITDTLLTIVLSLKENTNLIYEQSYNQKSFVFDTREIRSILGQEVPLHEMEVLNWIRNKIDEEISKLIES